MTDAMEETNRADVVAIFGPPDLMFTFDAEGVQLSFQGSNTDHRLALLFWSNHAAYFENDLLVGYSEYQSPCFHTFSFA